MSFPSCIQKCAYQISKLVKRGFVKLHSCIKIETDMEGENEEEEYECY